MLQVEEILTTYKRGYKRYVYIFIAFIAVSGLLSVISAEYLLSLIATDYAINGSISFLIALSSILIFKDLKVIDKEFSSFIRLRYDFEQGIPSNEGKYSLLAIVAKTCNVIIEKKGRLVITTTTEKKTILSFISDAIDTKIFYLGFMSATCVSLGLFGTFLGLTKTIASLSVILNSLYMGLDNPDADILTTMVQLIGELQAPLQGMSLAFATSLMGLIGSLVIGFEIIILSKSISAALDDLDTWFTQLIDDAAAEQEQKNRDKEQSLIDVLSGLTEAVRKSGEDQKELLERLVELEKSKPS